MEQCRKLQVIRLPLLRLYKIPRSINIIISYLFKIPKENGGTHRCVYASITVKAPVREVWNVLTAYEELPEYNVHSFSILLSGLSS